VELFRCLKYFYLLTYLLNNLFICLFDIYLFIYVLSRSFIYFSRISTEDDLTAIAEPRRAPGSVVSARQTKCRSSGRLAGNRNHDVTAGGRGARRS